IRADFAGVAHSLVQQRGLATPVTRRHARGLQRLRRGGFDGSPELAHPLHTDRDRARSDSAFATETDRLDSVIAATRGLGLFVASQCFEYRRRRVRKLLHYSTSAEWVTPIWRSKLPSPLWGEGLGVRKRLSRSGRTFNKGTPERGRGSIHQIHSNL